MAPLSSSPSTQVVVFFNGKTNISSGDTNIVTAVPEPGTLGLLGTGLIGVAGIVGRKLKSI
ncbi:MAG: hypothetical protein DMG76_15625 [Acidobacteria bacterium]|nr:MAG: hypothetical protein DMG76_15625 [Acidobacteriota bacterium]